GSSALHRRRQVRLDGSQHGFEAFGVARNDLAFLEEFMAAAEVADQAACFLNQQSTRSHVPLGQTELPEGVETAGGNVRQVQARSACAANACGLAGQAAEHVQVVVQVLELAITEREAGAEQGAFEALAIADAQAAAVQGGATTAAGGEFFLANRVEDDGVLEAAAVFAGDADGEMRYAAN